MTCNKHMFVTVSWLYTTYTEIVKIQQNFKSSDLQSLSHFAVISTVFVYKYLATQGTISAFLVKESF